jgi:hypothetical protein
MMEAAGTRLRCRWSGFDGIDERDGVDGVVDVLGLH